MKKFKTGIKGIAIIEFTIVSWFVFLLVFLILALGAYVFSLQMVSEATRKAARLATVCYVEDRDNIAGMVVAELPLIGFTNANLEVAYLDINAVKFRPVTILIQGLATLNLFVLGLRGMEFNLLII